MAKKKTPVKRAKSRKKSNAYSEPDSVFFMKLVLYLIVGSQWLRIEHLPDWSIPIPIGLLVGIGFAVHDNFAIDKKIEFALLLVASFISFWLPMGISVVV